jgi:hypothetical protein
MKTMKKYILLTLALAACLAGCKKEPEYGDAVFMTGTLTTPTIQFNIEGEQSIGLTVSSSAKAVSAVKVQIAPDPGLLEAYNVQVGGNYVLLRSRKPIAVDKHLMEALREAKIQFEVNAQI